MELKFFLFAQFLLKALIEQLVGLRKVRTENLKFRTDLQDQVMDCYFPIFLLSKHKVSIYCVSVH